MKLKLAFCLVIGQERAYSRLPRALESGQLCEENRLRARGQLAAALLVEKATDSALGKVTILKKLPQAMTEPACFYKLVRQVQWVRQEVYAAAQEQHDDAEMTQGGRTCQPSP